MKITDIRKKTDADLKKLLAEFTGKVREMRFKIASKELKNHQEMRAVRKDVARIMTILNQRQGS